MSPHSPTLVCPTLICPTYLCEYTNGTSVHPPREPTVGACPSQARPSDLRGDAHNLGGGGGQCVLRLPRVPASPPSAGHPAARCHRGAPPGTTAALLNVLPLASGTAYSTYLFVQLRLAHRRSSSVARMQQLGRESFLRVVDLAAAWARSRQLSRLVRHWRGMSGARVATAAGLGSAPTAPVGIARVAARSFSSEGRHGRQTRHFAADRCYYPSWIYCSGSDHCRQARGPLPIPGSLPPDYPGARLRRWSRALLLLSRLPSDVICGAGMHQRTAAGPNGALMRRANSTAPSVGPARFAGVQRLE
jgi:hypothetical protein